MRRTSLIAAQAFRPRVELFTLRNPVFRWSATGRDRDAEETFEFLILNPSASPVTWDPEMCVDGLRLSHENRAITSTGPTRSVRSFRV